MSNEQENIQEQLNMLKSKLDHLELYYTKIYGDAK